MNAATASKVKDDRENKPNDEKGAQVTANQNAPGGAPAAPARRPLGTKEVIPFAWKVIGLSGEMVLTLFKSIEKEDSEAHLARLEKDGAYKNLRLVEADFKIVQPKSVRAVLAANEKKAKTIAAPKKSKKKARETAPTIKLAKLKTTTSAVKKVKKVKKSVLASTATPKKKVKKAVKKSTSRTVKAKKSAKHAVKKKTKTKSSKKKTKAKKK